MADIQINQNDLAQVTLMLGGIEKEARIALRRALNRTLTGSKTIVSKKMREVCTLKAAKIKDNIDEKKANDENLSASLYIRGRAIAAINYKHSVLKNKGLRLQYFKIAGKEEVPNGFKATMPNGKVGLYIRDWRGLKKHRKPYPRRESRDNVWGSTELPIIELMGPPLTSVYEKTPNLSDTIESAAAERLATETEAQVNYILSKYA
jgi:hypothetical protein